MQDESELGTRYMSSAGDSGALPFQVSLSVAWIRRSYF
jgi:hypothetical protein